MSQNTYVRITEAEFDSFMNAYDAEAVSVPRVHEKVYDVPTDKPGLTVRVFSTISTSRNAGQARDAGNDAIRALAWSKTADSALEQATRTHRIGTWERNLAPKIAQLRENINSGEYDDRTPDATLAGLVPATEGENAVVVSDLVDTRYGRKATLESPYDAKDAIKNLPWDETHRSWDSDRNAWTVDASALPVVADALDAAGWPLRAPAPYTAGTVENVATDANEGDHVTVTYTAKNSENTLEKTGTVETVREDGENSRVSFRRDDGQLMSLTADDDALFTSGSHAPYVGAVIAVELTDENDDTEHYGDHLTHEDADEADENDETTDEADENDADTDARHTADVFDADTHTPAIGHEDTDSEADTADEDADDSDRIVDANPIPTEARETAAVFDAPTTDRPPADLLAEMREVANSLGPSERDAFEAYTAELPDEPATAR